MTVVNPSSINRPLSQNNDGGLKMILYFALYADVATFPAPPENPADYGAKVTYTGGFTMKAGKQFHSIECVIEKNGLTSTSVGSVASISAENILNIILDNIIPEYQGFFENHKNDAMIFVVEDLSHQRKMIGTEGLPAYFQAEGEHTGGAAVADDKQMMISVRSVGRIAPFLADEVTVPLTPAASGS